VPPGQHESAAAELAARICGQPPLATALAKQALDRGQDADLEAALALERQHAVQTSQSGEAAAPREAFSGE
jgi:enoyl-CoA hydratase/carnithine racemase